jgi:hypothetical protein
MIDAGEVSVSVSKNQSKDLSGSKLDHSKIGSSAFSLVCMFQVVTACCIFFAILKTSAMLAIVGTLIATPAIIRTSIASDLHQKAGYRFSWMKRIICFLESTGLTVVTFAIAAIIFALISLLFGLLCLGCSFVLGADEMSGDIAFVGTIGGMVWGAAGAILAFAFCMRKWQMKIGPSKKVVDPNH